jgi:hypothetical protein
MEHESPGSHFSPPIPLRRHVTLAILSDRLNAQDEQGRQRDM